MLVVADRVGSRANVTVRPHAGSEVGPDCMLTESAKMRVFKIQIVDKESHGRQVPSRNYLILIIAYTVSQKRPTILIVHNFAKCWPIFSETL